MTNSPVSWQIAWVDEIRPETPSVKSFSLRLPAWTPHRAGQHYDVRLTAPDGYQAQRSYSIASAPERTGIVELTVERIDEGEVSTYMHDVLAPGDRIEVRGPIGGYFVWEAANPDPLLLVAGGSGIVPLMAMIRHRHLAGAANPTRLLYSSRTLDDIIYGQELESLQAAKDGLEVFHTLTRSQPAGWSGFSRRIDRPMIEQVASPLQGRPVAFICGPTLLVETSAEHLVSFGFDPVLIKTERFGPTGA